MSTPRLDLVYDGFIRGIGGRWETAFDPTSGMDIPDSNFIDKEIIPKYINRALWKLFDSVWMQVHGDVKSFIAIFPELTKTGNFLFTSGIYTLISDKLDLYAIAGALTTSDDYVSVWGEDKYTLVKSGKNRSYIPDSSNQAIIKMANKIYLFPEETFTHSLHYVVSPTDPTTGGPLTQNGSYDMPFDYTRVNTLIELAVGIYNQAAQETA